MATVTARLLVRQGTQAQWAVTDPILSLGEFGLDTTQAILKMGDGVTAWSSLDYIANTTQGAALIAAQVGVTIQQHSNRLDDIAALSPTLNNFITGDGSNWVKVGPTAAATALGLGDMALQDKSAVDITGGAAVLSTLDVTTITPTTIAGGKINGGVNAAQSNDGAKSSGTYTFELGDNNFRRLQNAGSFTMAPGASDNISMVVRLDNNVGAGAINLSAFTKVTGDALTTNSSDSFMLYYTQVGTTSHLHIVALQ